MNKISIPLPRKREFLPIDFRLTVWSRLKPYCNDLLGRPVDGPQALSQWLRHRAEIAWLLAGEWQCRQQKLRQWPQSDMARAEVAYLAEQILPKALRVAAQLDDKLRALSGGISPTRAPLHTFWLQHCR
ncbi:MAG: hypothetical protein AAFW73_22285 [Bacteroidota bacterium]